MAIGHTVSDNYVSVNWGETTDNYVPVDWVDGAANSASSGNTTFTYYCTSCPYIGICKDEGGKCQTCKHGAKRSYYEPLPEPCPYPYPWYPYPNPYCPTYPCNPVITWGGPDAIYYDNDTDTTKLC